MMKLSGSHMSANKALDMSICHFFSFPKSVDIVNLVVVS